MDNETGMGDELHLMSDGDGLAVYGSSDAVERFFATYNFPSRDLELQRLGTTLGRSAGIAEVGSIAAAQSGRWLKLTEESAQAMNHLPMVVNSSTKNLHATLRAPNGQFAKNLQFVPGSLKSAKGVAALLTNPAMLAGVAGIMSQLAMQQTMDEITSYLEGIDEKVDDILRAHKDAVIADMIGVDLMIEEAMVVRQHTGRVSDITWSKVHASPGTIARTQAYALRQLDGIAEKLERQTQVGELAKAIKEAEPQVKEWLAVIARCFYLNNATDVIELDRVLDAAPDELNGHRLALRAARQRRIERVSQSTVVLIERMNGSASYANQKVLLNPLSSRAVVDGSGTVVGDITQFHSRIGVDSGGEAIAARRWRTALGDVRDRVVDTTSSRARIARDQLGEATEMFRSVDIDGDGSPDKPRARAAVEEAGGAFKEAASVTADAFGSLFKRKKNTDEGTGEIEASRPGPID